MVNVTNDVDIAYVAETYYAGGLAGAELAQTTSTTTASFTAFNFPKGEQQMPLVVYDRDQLKYVGAAGAAYRVTFNKGIKYMECTQTVFPQNATWITAALACAVNAVPTSYYFKYKNALTAYDCFGMQLQKYELSLSTSESNEFATEALTWIYYNAAQASYLASNKGFDTSTAPLIMKDLTLTYNTNVITNSSDITKFTLTIENELADSHIGGRYYRMKPILVSRTITAKITLRTTSDTLFAYPRTEANTLASLVVQLGSKWTKTFSNMSLTESNQNKIPEAGLYEYEITLVNAGSTAIT